VPEGDAADRDDSELARRVEQMACRVPAVEPGELVVRTFAFRSATLFQ
jgi:hypothetical protein